MSRLANTLTKLYLALFFCMVAVLTAASAVQSEYFELGRDIEVPSLKQDHPLVLVVVFVFVLAAVLAAQRDSSRKELAHMGNRGHIVILLAIVSGGASLFFLLNLQSQPYMDCGVLVEIADQFNKGDFSALNIATQDSYLWIYPFQIGFIGFLQLLFRIFGEGNYFALQLCNVAGVMLMTRNLYEIAGEIYGNPEDRKGSEENNPLQGQKTYWTIMKLTMIFLMCCFPLFIDVTFVYGDVLGWSFAVGALLCVFRWVNRYRKGKDGKKHIGYLIAACVLVGAGVQLKTNSYIFLIAMAIILILEAMHKKSAIPLLFCAIMIVLTALISNAIQLGYAKAAGIEEFPSGTPASCWIAMGMKEDDTFENGWYNGLNIQIFEAGGYDPEAANQMAKEFIWERLTQFIAHPKSAVKFYLIKFVSAWNDPQFNSQIKMEWGSRRIENLGAIATQMIYGTGRQVLHWFMNILHFVILCGAAAEAFLALNRRRREAVLAAYLALPALGGAIFHLLWETQARYMVGYYSLLFPLAAAGIVHLAQTLLGCIGRKKQERRWAKEDY